MLKEILPKPLGGPNSEYYKEALDKVEAEKLDSLL